MTIQHIAVSTVLSNRRITALKIFFWVFITIALLFTGVLIEIGPKWPAGLIHIHISPGHGFTDQDAVALIPISLAFVWFGIGIWRNRTFLRDYVRRTPEKAVITTLIIGLLLGLVIGIGLGTVFKSRIISFIK